MKSVASVVLLVGVFAFFACSDDSEKSPSPAIDGGGSSSSSGTPPASDASSSGTSGTSGTSGNTVSQEKVYCDAVTSRKDGCSQGGDGVCEDAGKCLYGRLMKPEATAAYAECYGAPTCKSDDECVAVAGTKAGGSAATDYATACQSKRTACGATFSADFCGSGAFAYSGVGEAAKDCLAKPCADIKTCLTDIYAPLETCK